MKKLFLLCILFIHFFMSMGQINMGNRNAFLPDEPDLKVGDVRVYDVLFEFNKCNFYPEFSDTLNYIAKFLTARTDIVVEILTHSDTRSSGNCCYNITQCRANAIVDYLVKNGVSESQLIPIGVQDRQPLIPESVIDEAPDDETKEIYHKINRRVEVKIRSINGFPKSPLEEFQDRRPTFDYTNGSKVKLGDIKVLNVLFTREGSGAFYPEFNDTVDLLANYLISNPNIQIEISVHDDSRSNEEYAIRITYNMAEYIKYYLIAKNVPEKQITILGKGGTEPIIPKEIINEEPSDILREKYHKKNRRVELKIISKKLRK